jgi:hypothetical protein
MNDNEINIILKAQNEQLKAKLSESEKELKKFTDKTKEHGSGISSVFDRIGQTVTNLKNIFIVGFFATVGVKLAELAGRVDTVRNTFDSLTQSAGKSGDVLLKQLQVASRGTVDNLELMKSANLAMSLGGQRVIEMLPKMTEIAFAAAKLQGKDVKTMLNDMVTATGRASTMILDNLGVSSAAANAAMDKYAATLGKTQMQLSATEKQAAFYNAVLVSGNMLMKQVDMSTLSFGERLQILRAQSNNLVQDLSTKLIPAFEDIAEILSAAPNDQNIIYYIAWAAKFTTSALRLLIVSLKFLPELVKESFREFKDNIIDAIDKLEDYLSGTWFGRMVGIKPKIKPEFTESSDEFDSVFNKYKKAVAEIDCRAPRGRVD